MPIFFVSTFIVIWADLKFDILTQIAGTLGNFAISFVMVLALRLNSKLPSSYRTHRVMWIGGFISALIQIAFAGISIWSLGGKIFGGWAVAHFSTVCRGFANPWRAGLYRGILNV